MNLLEMIRGLHPGASSVILKTLKLEADKRLPFQDIFVDAIYFGRVPTTENPEGR